MQKINDIEFLGDKIIGIGHPEEVFSEEILNDLKELREIDRHGSNILGNFVLIFFFLTFIVCFFYYQYLFFQF